MSKIGGEMKQTCGPLYKTQFDFYTDGDREKIRTFAAGFISGQAEKIYLGACAAAMFRPSAENVDLVLDIAEQVRKTYGLYVTTIGDEVWLFSEAATPAIAILANTVKDTRAFHMLRGILTGVPLKEIDYEFQKRKGYGEVCDK